MMVVKVKPPNKLKLLRRESLLNSNNTIKEEEEENSDGDNGKSKAIEDKYQHANIKESDTSSSQECASKNDVEEYKIP